MALDPKNSPAASAAAPACVICGATDGPFFAAGPANEPICKACDAEMNGGPLLGKADKPPAQEPVDTGPLLGKAGSPPIKPAPPKAAEPLPVNGAKLTVSVPVPVAKPTVPTVRQAPPARETYPPQARRGVQFATPAVTYPPQAQRRPDFAGATKLSETIYPPQWKRPA